MVCVVYVVLTLASLLTTAEGLCFTQDCRDAEKRIAGRRKAAGKHKSVDNNKPVGNKKPVDNKKLTDKKNLEQIKVEGRDSTVVKAMVESFGYPFEIHEIRTTDGYLLTYHRIPYGKNGPTEGKRKPILLQHGLLCSSAAWLLTKNAFGYVLADAGFDVWLGNARGTSYSRRHVRFDPDKDHKAYWEFSFHEMGYFDLPAGIDHIRKKTKQEKVVYIGHSMGTTMYLAMGATRPEYMSKIHVSILMSPIAYPWNVRSPFATFIPLIRAIVACFYKPYEMVDRLTSDMQWASKNVCLNKKLQKVCIIAIMALVGWNMDQFDPEILTPMLKFMPAGTTRKNLQHFAQIRIKAHGFRQFDYGPVSNIWFYGDPIPPEYDLSKVTSPIIAYYSKNDWINSPEDAKRTVDALPNVIKFQEVPQKSFNHMDFMTAKDGKKLVYDDVIKSINELED